LTDCLSLGAQEAVSPFAWVPLVLAIGQALAVAFVLHALLARRSSATLTWTIFVLLTPFLGLILFYLMPHRIRMKRLRRRASQMAWIEPQLDELALRPDSPTHRTDPLERLLLSMDSESVSDGNRIELLAAGTAFTRRAVAAIESARRFVHLETYILRPDRAGLALLELLAATAARGVEVRVLFDNIGSWWLRAKHLAPLHAAGGKSSAYLPLLWRRRPLTLNLRNHRKLLLVDGEIAFLGGRNVGEEYVRDRFGKGRRWHDLMVELAGPVVRRLQRTFVEDWYNATDEDLANEAYFPETRPRGSASLGVIASGPDIPHSRIDWVLLQLISSAQARLDISTPYFLPHEGLIAALQVAAGRKVHVRVLTNGPRSEAFILYRAGRSQYRELLACGVEIREMAADYNHAKLIIVDDKYVLSGSHNLDMRSSRLNFEVAVVGRGSELAAAARQIFDQRCARALPVTLAILRQDSKVSVLTQGLCRLAAPVL
jgi:cardiolipin synthase